MNIILGKVFFLKKKYVSLFIRYLPKKKKKNLHFNLKKSKYKFNWNLFFRAPGENWSPVKSNKLEYLHMTNSSMTMKRELYKNRMEFIDTIPMTVNNYKV